jgi:uncharacterized protein YbjT (DUF2867 family)
MFKYQDRLLCFILVVVYFIHHTTYKRPTMLVIQGASGKLGFATLNAILEHNLLPPTDITVTSSSDAGAAKLKPATEKGVKLVTAEWDKPGSWETAFKGADKLFLISSARIEKDFNDAPHGEGREADHFPALEVAKKVGVKHVYYTSLAFANPSKSRVMKAHERTEEYLRREWPGKFTIIREGLYNESWPLYFGHYDVPNDSRDEVITGGDGPISWTSIPNLGLANALILAAPSSEWADKAFYLSQRQTRTLKDVAGMVSKAKGKQVAYKTVSREEHEKFYVHERGMPEAMITWWSKSYDALRDNECQIDDPTLEQLLASKGVKPTPMEETVTEMLKT